MKKILSICFIIASCFIITSCDDYLDVNTNPNGPDSLLEPEFFLPQIQSELALGLQRDGRFAGHYTQNWFYVYTRSTSRSINYHGNPLSDAYAYLWRAVYWSMGHNLSDMILSAEQSKKYDFVGVGYILRAFGWQVLTDYHGPVILKQAFDTSRRAFDYDEQQEVYAEVQRLLQLGIESLERTDGLSSTDSGLRDADLIYAGDRDRWIKLAYGLLAINAQRLTNKSTYDANKVIEYVDKSFTSNADDALVPFQGEVSANTNFFGPLRRNIGVYRQSEFIVGLLDGTNPVLTDPTLVVDGVHSKDPRLAAMLAPAPDGEYRGARPESARSDWITSQRPYNLWSTTGYRASEANPQIYFFNNDAAFPVMTYAQLQFIKAEAAFIANNKSVALEAYKNGVNAHIDFAEQYATDKAVYADRKAAYLASEVFLPNNEADLTLSKIMLQKYIATWGWAFIDTWSDMRRYHYDIDASTPVYAGFELPEFFASSNNEKPIYRARPRYNSEYVWNRDALDKIGGFDEDYHTKEMWFSTPE